MPAVIQIKVPFRLHITLISMHQCEFRKNGGIGVSVNTGCLITINAASKTSIDVNGHCNDFSKLLDIQKLVESILVDKKMNIKPKINIQGDLFFHSGLGVGTAITLACVEGVYRINDVEYTDVDIQKASRRGGTSGIGINSYFSGGFIFDLGHAVDNKAHTPSSFSLNHVIPTSGRVTPFNFTNLYFIIPKDLPLVSRESERKFFVENTPIADAEAFEICYLSTFGVLASVLDNDLEQFHKSIEKIQNTKWKSMEIANVDENVRKLMAELRLIGCLGVGMSSLGNGVFFIAPESTHQESVRALVNQMDATLLTLSPCNSGRFVSCLS